MLLKTVLGVVSLMPLREPCVVHAVKTLDPPTKILNVCQGVVSGNPS